jgi:hypothetical protein
MTIFYSQHRTSPEATRAFHPSMKHQMLPGFLLPSWDFCLERINHQSLVRTDSLEIFNHGRNWHIPKLKILFFVCFLSKVFLIMSLPPHGVCKNAVYKALHRTTIKKILNNTDKID